MNGGTQSGMRGPLSSNGHALLRGTVWHHRHREIDHSFSYPILMVALDLSAPLPNLPPFFRVDTPALLSLRTNDFLLERGADPLSDSVSLIERLSTLVTRHGETLDADTIILVTTPRLFGYAFNPVNFYLCNRNGITEQLVCEVHNTFGQTHRYLARQLSEKSSAKDAVFEFPKEFCVSPFLDRSGTYRVIVSQPNTLPHSNPSKPTSRLSVTVELYHGETRSFAAGVTGLLLPLTTSSLLRGLVAVPSTGWLTMTRISLQALVLILRRVSSFPLLPLRNPTDTPRCRSWIEQLRVRILSAITRGKFFEERDNLALKDLKQKSG